MTLIRQIYDLLHQAQLTRSRQAFSRDYVGKNINWCAYQTHVNRDFPLAASVQCLRSIRLVRERDQALDRVQVAALREAEALLLEYLNEHYRIAEVVA